MEELNMILSDFAQEGAHESSGVFTLSLDKAGEKLAEYRLHNPALFVLNLVAAAVTGGATHFAVETRDNVTSMRFDPKVELDEEQLERLFAFILEPAAPVYVRELALAMHGARSLPGKPTLRLQVATREFFQELCVRQQDQEIVDIPSRPSGVTLLLEYGKAVSLSRLFSRQKQGDQITEHLFHFCRFAPLAMTNNGQVQGSRVTAGVYESSVFAWRYLKGEQPLKAVTAERRFDLMISRKTQSPVASSVVLTLVDQTQSVDEGVLLISRGVTFRRPPAILGFPLARAVITADHLEKNLSQSDLVEGEEFNKLIEAVRAEVDDLILELCASPPPKWSLRTSRIFLANLDRRYPEGEPAPLQVEVFRRLLDLEKACGTSKGQKEQMAFWRQLSARDPQAGHKFRGQLTEFFKGLARRCIADDLWGLAACSQKHLCELEERPADALRVALLTLAKEHKAAGALLTPQLPGYTPALAYLVGWHDTLEENHPTAWLFRLQRAVEQGDLQSADVFAEHLKESKGTPLLYLWLGWYAVYRKRYFDASRLWDKTISLVGNDDWQYWTGQLWKELNGKVTFIDQVRWQAKRNIEEMQRTLWSGNDRRHVYGRQPLVWAAEVWVHLMDGQVDLARNSFVKTYLSARIDHNSLRLEPLDGYGSRLDFFA